MNTYRIKFIEGILKGIKTTIRTPVRFQVGKTYRSCVTSGAYVVYMREVSK